MPYGRRHYRKRFYARSSNNSSWPSRYQTPGSADLIVPDRHRVKLKYYTTAVVNTAAPAYTDLSGNSVYDPLASAGGTQPVGYDQWAALYSTYVVLASAIKSVYISGSAVAAKLVLIPTTTDSLSIAQSVTELAQNNYAKTGYTGNTGGGHDLCRQKHYMSTSEIIGVSPSRVIDDPNLSSATTTNPASRWYWCHAIQAMDGSSVVTGRVDYVVTYYVEFFNRSLQFQS